MKTRRADAGGRPLPVVLLLLLLPVFSLFSDYTSDYYRDKLRYFPRFYFYQRSYILALAKEKKPDQARRFIEKVRGAGQPSLALLLEGILFMQQGRATEARTVWRRFWPLSIREYTHLEREYNTHNLKEEQGAFFRYLADRHSDNPAILKKALLYSLQEQKIAAAVSQLVRLRKADSRSLYGLARGLAGYLADRERQDSVLKELERQSRAMGPFAYRLLTRWGRAAEAAGYLLQLYRERRVDAVGAAALARRLYQDGHAALYRKVITRLPEKELPGQDRLLLAALLEPGEPERAARIYAGLAGSDEAARGLARIRLRGNDLSAALKHAGRIRTRQESDWVLLGKIHALRKELKQALDAFSRVPQPARGIHSAVALLVSGSKSGEVKLPLVAALQTIPGDGSALPGLELLYRLQFYTLTAEQKKQAAAALLLVWTEQPLRAGAMLEGLGLAIGGRPGARMLLEAADLAVRAGEWQTAERRLTTVINKKLPLPDRALYRLALLYRDHLGQKERARGLLLRLVANHPASLYIYESRRELSGWK